jgi:hypothetical protein
VNTFYPILKRKGREEEKIKRVLNRREIMKMKMFGCDQIFTTKYHY